MDVNLNYLGTSILQPPASMFEMTAKWGGSLLFTPIGGCVSILHAIVCMCDDLSFGCGDFSPSIL